MFVLCLVLAAAAGATATGVAAGLQLWQAAVCFLGYFLLLHVLFAGTYLLAGVLCVDQSKPIAKRSRFFNFGAWWISNLCCTYGMVKVTVTGKEKIPAGERFLMVSNHRSGFDPLVVLSSMREFGIAFISKESNMKIPMCGNIAYGAGFLGSDRENDRNALRTILTAADYMKKDFCSMFVYPEGTRSKGCEMLPFHAGSFKIAQRANAPLVIVATEGTEKLKENAFRRRTNVRLEVLEVLDAATVKRMSTAELSEYTRNKLEEKLGEEKKNA